MKLRRIGLLISRSYEYYRGVLRGVARYAETKPNWSFMSVAPERSSLRRLSRLDVEGFIASVHTRELVESLRRIRRPVVNVSSVFPDLRFPRAGVDNAHVGRLAAEHFLERGLRNFGFVGPVDHLYSRERREAFCRVVQEAGGVVACHHTPADAPFDPLGERWDLGRQIYSWLRALPKPAGVFVPNDDWGAQVSEACRQTRLRIPEDVAVLGVGDDPLDCEFARPPLSSIVLPTERIGYQAAGLLERLLAGEKPPVGPTLIPALGVATRRSTEILAIEDEEVLAAVRFIREHSHVPLCVTDILREVPVSRRSLERRCRKHLGRSLAKEIQRTHLERACHLLANTDLSMKILAHQAGFANFRHLAVVFRKELKITPTAYRGKMRGNEGVISRLGS